MKSIQIKRFGGSDVVEVNDNTSIPTVSVGKILVNVKASGVNPADWKIREGYFQRCKSILTVFSNDAIALEDLR